MTDSYYTPHSLGVGKWALVNVAGAEPPRMELVLVVGKQANGVTLTFTCVGEDCVVRHFAEADLFQEVLEGKAGHPKHIRVGPQRPSQSQYEVEMSKTGQKMLDWILAQLKAPDCEEGLRALLEGYQKATGLEAWLVLRRPQ